MFRTGAFSLQCTPYFEGSFPTC